MKKTGLPGMPVPQKMKKGFTLFTPLVGMVILVIALVMIINIINTEKNRVSVIVDYQSSLKESATLDFARMDAIHTVIFQFKAQSHNMFLKKYFNNDLEEAIFVSTDRDTFCTVVKDFFEPNLRTILLTNMTSNVFDVVGKFEDTDSGHLVNIGDYSIGLVGSLTDYDISVFPDDCFSSKDGSFAVEIKPPADLSKDKIARIVMANNLTGEESVSPVIPEGSLIVPVPIRFMKAADIAFAIQDEILNLEGPGKIKSWGLCDLESAGAQGCDCWTGSSYPVDCMIHGEAEYFGKNSRLDCTREVSVAVPDSSLEISLPVVWEHYDPKTPPYFETDFERKCLDSEYDDVYASDEITAGRYMNSVSEKIGGVLSGKNAELKSSASNIEFAPLYFDTLEYRGKIDGVFSDAQFFIREGQNSGKNRHSSGFLEKVVFPTKYFRYTVDNGAGVFDGCSRNTSYVQYPESGIISNLLGDQVNLKPALCAQVPEAAYACFTIVDKGFGIPGGYGITHFEPEENQIIYHPMESPMSSTTSDDGGISVPFVFCVSLAGENNISNSARANLKEEWDGATKSALPYVEGLDLQCADHFMQASPCDICTGSASESC